MRLLLDTHVLLWQFGGARRLGPRAEAALASSSEVALSVVSLAEIGVKTATGELKAQDDIVQQVARAGIRLLSLAPEHGLAVGELPRHHGDPFDRLLVAQARAEGYTLLSADTRLRAYDVPVLDPLV